MGPIPGGSGTSALGVWLRHGTVAKPATHAAFPCTPRAMLAILSALLGASNGGSVPPPSPAHSWGHVWLSPGALPPAALMRSDGHYVLNGDWSIAWPGPYEVAGTRLLYARSSDGTESLEAPGPTDEDLHVLVGSRGSVGMWAAAPSPNGPLSSAPECTGAAAGAQPRHRVRVLAAPRAPPAQHGRYQCPAAAPAPWGRQPPTR